MTEAPESRVLPRFIDARKLAQQGGELRGVVPVVELERLPQGDSENEQAIGLELFLTKDDQGHLTVTGTIKGEVTLECQRCLSDLKYRVSSSVNVAIVSDEEKAKQLPKSIDPWLVTDASADLYSLIEEEILLSLPMVAYHEQPCIDQKLYSTTEEENSGPEQQAVNPFSVLEQLKGTPNKH